MFEYEKYKIYIGITVILSQRLSNVDMLLCVTTTNFCHTRSFIIRVLTLFCAHVAIYFFILNFEFVVTNVIVTKKVYFCSILTSMLPYIFSSFDSTFGSLDPCGKFC